MSTNAERRPAGQSNTPDFGTAQAIYQQMGLKVTYLSGEDKIRAEVTISPETFMQIDAPHGAMGRVRGGT